MAGGGLGPNARLGIKLEDFVVEDEIFQVAEALKRIFDKHGDRLNRQRARLSYVVERLGKEEFIRLYLQERNKLFKKGLDGQVPRIDEISARIKNYEVIISKSNGEEKLPSYVIPEKEPGQ